MQAIGVGSSRLSLKMFKTGSVMLGNVLALLILCTCSVVPAIASRVARQAPNLSCQGNGVFAHPTDCSKFLNCWDGQPTVQDCGPGQGFIPESRVCGYVPNCQARGGGSSLADQACGQNQGQGRVRAGEAVLAPHPQYCNVHFICDNSHGNQPCVVCALGTVFSSVNLTCVTPEGFGPAYLNTLSVSRPEDLISSIEQIVRTSRECSNSQYVQFRDVTTFRLNDPTCGNSPSQQTTGPNRFPTTRPGW